jgi:6-phosphogluconolactonase (cycloisomerase 2 family)
VFCVTVYAGHINNNFKVSIMKQLKVVISIALLGWAFLLNGCGGGGGSGVSPGPSPTPGASPVITVFSINGSAGVITGNRIAVTLPYGTGVTALVATFTAPGTIVTVGNIPQRSGISTNDFSNPVVYTITRVGAGSTGSSAKAAISSSDTTTSYTVTVTVASITAKAVTAFSLGIPNSTISVRSGIISVTNINVTVPFGTNVTSLIATFTISGTRVTVNGVVQENGVTPNDFTTPVTYTVTAADGSTQDYIVTVTVAAASDNNMIAFSLNGTPGVISSGGLSQTIVVKVPFDTNVNGLVATFITSGVSVAVNGVPQVSGTTQNNFTSSVDYIVTAADGSTRTYTVTVLVSGASSKFINDYSFGNIIGVISNQDIIITVPFGTNVTALIASFTTTGVNVTVGDMTQTSTATPNDFTNQVTYTVYAADGSTATYTVTVIVSSSTAKAITSFAFGTTAGVITDHNIAITMPFGTDVTDLTAIFTTTGTSVSVNGTPQSSGSAHNDFTNPVIYTVTAADGSTAEYVVTVSVAASSAKAITSFILAGATGVITNFNIAVTVPFGTNPAALVATFTTTGASVMVNGVTQFSGTTTNNFSSPVTYTVVAADGSIQNYVVTVTVAASSAKAITSFILANESGIITGTNITVTVPHSTNLSSLVATFSTTGISVFVGSTQQVSGSISAHDFTTPVSYVVNAADGSSATYTVTVTVAPAYVYVSNFGSASVSMYSINDSTGLLTALSTPTIASGTQPYFITLDPSKKHVYTTNFGDSSISVYNIDIQTGQLSLASTVTSGLSKPTGITFNSAGTFAYVSNYGTVASPPYASSLAQYSVDPATGALTSLSPATISLGSTGALPVCITTNPSGTYVYIANSNSATSRTVDWYSINSSSGLLTFTSALTGINIPQWIVFNSSGNFAYVLDSNINLNVRLAADPTTGALSFSSSSIATGANPQRITINSAGTFMYVTNSTGNTVSIYTINGNGSLTALGSAVAAGSSPQQLAFDSSGNYAYVTSSGNNTIRMYSVSSGALSPLGTPTIGAGTSPWSIVVKY